MTKRLRLFAGPNGSGKSTIKDDIKEKGYLRELYINPDDIEKQFNTCREFDLSNFKIHPSEDIIQSFFKNSQLLINNNRSDEANNFKLDKLFFSIFIMNQTILFSFKHDLRMVSFN